ncbi:immunoglobulin domain-containing protein [Adhaeribacter aquaticus]|uniref:immunoglobulin domain-containing protein n=1 Tax=Adhaeribacter aquaticus TaxID=299567 RepID=UPI0005509EFD|nr:hypothetical protein [Adhaeribacter aquaticus]
MFKFRLLLFFLLFSFTSFGQVRSGWQEWLKVYEDTDLKVEVQFYYPRSKCIPNARPFQFHTKVTGKYKPIPTFLNWTFDYKDCNGVLRYQTSSIEIGKNGGGESDGVPVENLDYNFNASSLEVKFYNVVVSENYIKESGIKEQLKAPAEITGNTEIVAGTLSLLQVVGGPLAKGAKWVWYEKACGGTNIGNGNTISVNPSETTTYFVRAERISEVTECAQVTVVVKQLNIVAAIPAPAPAATRRRFGFPANYFQNSFPTTTTGKVRHLGVGVGLEGLQYAEFGRYNVSAESDNNFTSYSATNIDMQGVGVKGELVFHPYIKEKVSVGFTSSFSTGISPLSLSGGDKTLGDNSSFQEKYSYSKLYLGSEVAVGGEMFKGLIKVGQSTFANNYNITFTNNATPSPTYIYDKRTSREKISAGIRIDSYNGNSRIRRGNNLDVTYNLTRHQVDGEKHWVGGFGLVYWLHNICKLEFDITSPPPPSIFSADPNKYKNINYQVSLIYNKNWFR